MFWPNELGPWKAVRNLQISPDERVLTKNRKLLPSDLSASSRESVWWQCGNNPEHKPYKATVWSRTQWGAGCPDCAADKIHENSLEKRFPAVAKLWHPSRNLPLTPAEVTYGSGKYVWWRCFKSADHVYQARVYEVRKAHQEGRTSCVFCRSEKQMSRKSG
jgi:hypothetical protein